MSVLAGIVVILLKRCTVVKGMSKWDGRGETMTSMGRQDLGVGYKWENYRGNGGKT